MRWEYGTGIFVVAQALTVLYWVSSLFLLAAALRSRLKIREFYSKRGATHATSQ